MGSSQSNQDPPPQEQIEALPAHKQVTITICIIGPSGAGKTTFVNDWLRNANYSPCHYDGEKHWRVKSASDIAADPIELRIMDWPSNLLGSDFWKIFRVVIFVYDLSLDPDHSNSILCSRGWFNDIRTKSRASNIAIIGMKSDSEKPLARAAGEEVAKLVGAKFFAVSHIGTNAPAAVAALEIVRDSYEGRANDAYLRDLDQTPAFSPSILKSLAEGQ